MDRKKIGETAASIGMAISVSALTPQHSLLKQIKSSMGIKEEKNKNICPGAGIWGWLPELTVFRGKKMAKVLQP